MDSNQLIPKKLLFKLLQKSLSSHVTEILHLSSGFDIAVVAPSQIIANFLLDMLGEAVSQGNYSLSIVRNIEELKILREQQFSSVSSENTIFVHDGRTQLLGAGFIDYRLPTPVELLPSIALTTGIVLRFFKLA
jgi:hypothetical protein